MVKIDWKEIEGRISKEIPIDIGRVEKSVVLEKIDEILNWKLEEEKKEQLRNLKRRSNWFTGLALLKQASWIVWKNILE